MSLLRTASRVAVASAVHGKVQRRQQQRWAAQDQAPAPAAPVAAAPVIGTDDLITQLERLGQLRDSGVLTEAEFAAQKATPARLRALGAVFFLMISTGSNSVASAVTSQTTIVAPTHDPIPRIESPCVNTDARINAARVDTRPMPPRNADA